MIVDSTFHASTISQTANTCEPPYPIPRTQEQIVKTTAVPAMLRGQYHENERRSSQGITESQASICDNEPVQPNSVKLNVFNSVC